MIFEKWRTTKTIREIRKIKKKQSMKSHAMTMEEWMKDEDDTMEWFEKEMGMSLETIDNSQKKTVGAT
jgi:hypothetical protein